MSRQVLILHFREHEKVFKQLKDMLSHSKEVLDTDSKALLKNLNYLTHISLQLPTSRVISFGKFLKATRKFLSEGSEEKITLKRLGEMSNLSATKLTELENDHFNKISIEEIFKLEEALDIPLFLIISKFGYYSAWPVADVESLVREAYTNDRCCA